MCFTGGWNSTVQLTVSLFCYSVSSSSATCLTLWHTSVFWKGRWRNKSKVTDQCLLTVEWMTVQLLGALEGMKANQFRCVTAKRVDHLRPAIWKTHSCLLQCLSGLVMPGDGAVFLPVSSVTVLSFLFSVVIQAWPRLMIQKRLWLLWILSSCSITWSVSYIFQSINWL